VTAQQQYASMNPDASQGVKYAQKSKARPGKWMASFGLQRETKRPVRSGLWWRKPMSRVIPGTRVRGRNRSCYYFRILTRQGKAAVGGKMNYMDHGNLTMGFALVAYPANWDQSGVMTFIVNQKAQVFQRNLGENTSTSPGR